jgi:hypothetical protein
MDSFIPCNSKLRPASKTDELKNKSFVSVSGYLNGIYFKARAKEHPKLAALA